MYAGSAPLEHVALQQAVDGLAAAVAAGYTTPADMSRKRKVGQHHDAGYAVQSQQSCSDRCSGNPDPACQDFVAPAVTQQFTHIKWHCRQRAASAGVHLGRSVSVPCARTLMARQRHWQATTMRPVHGARSAGPRSSGCEPLCNSQQSGQSAAAAAAAELLASMLYIAKQACCQCMSAEFRSSAGQSATQSRKPVSEGLIPVPRC